LEDGRKRDLPSLSYEVAWGRKERGKGFGMSSDELLNIYLGFMTKLDSKSNDFCCSTSTRVWTTDVPARR